MVNSQNGWPASPNKRDIGVGYFAVNGVEFVGGVKGGDVATVFTYVLTRFAAEVEAFIVPGCWGWAYRDVRGATSLSNHASGTAVDVNAPLHPLGSMSTFTPAQRQRIRSIVTACAGVVRWGGDYSGRKDEMHFEIVGDVTAVANLATAIRKNQEGAEMAWGPNDLLTQELWHQYSEADARKYGLPAGQTIEKHKLGEWMTVGWIRQGLILSELQAQTALMREHNALVRDQVQLLESAVRDATP